MGYIIMGRDECNEEFRASPGEWATFEMAANDIPRLRQRYPEARNLWVEQLRDKDYYLQQMEERDYE